MPGKKVYLYHFTAAEPRGFSGHVGGGGVRAGKGRAFMLGEEAQLSRSCARVGWWAE